MPPKKSAAAAGEDQGPALKLVIDKGPLSGTTREFRPGVTVGIGRVVRGNTMAVKDAGISSKHLLFQADASDSRRWTVTDLDSSNGTILNGAQLEPSEPVVLSHGDVIKIGELTSITVEMVSEAENEVGSGVRRNARRRARAPVADLGKIEEDAELGLQNNDDEEKIEVEAKQGRNVNTKRTRSSAKNVNLAKDLNVEEGKELGQRGVSTRRTKSSIKEEKIEEMAVDFSVIEGKKTTRGGRNLAKDLNVEEDKELGQRGVSTRMTRSSKKEGNIEEIEVDLSVIEGKKTTRGGRNLAKDLNVEEDKELGQRGVITRRTRSSKNEGNVEEIEVDLSVIERKKTTRGGRGRKKLLVETISEETEKEEPNPDHETHEEEIEKSEVGVDEPGLEKNSVTEGVTSSTGVDVSGIEVKSSVTEGVAAGASSSAGVQEGKLEGVKGKMVVDLEKMTLGEWFDYLEEYEPRHIIEETEKMIAEMKRNAERCHRYILEQKKKKAQGSS